jgi:hypothetical protein
MPLTVRLAPEAVRESSASSRWARADFVEFLDADLHRPGTVCPGCGGSFHT